MNDKTPAAIDRLLDDIPIGHPPVGDLLIAGRTAKRRNRRTLIVGVAAATVLILGGGAIATQAFGDNNAQDNNLVADRTPKPPTPSATNTDASTPDGTRLVGIGQVAVAVPTTWTANTATCNTPRGDTYYFPYAQNCVGMPDPLSNGGTSLALTTGGFAEGDILVDGLTPDGELDGHQIVSSGDAACRDSLPAACTQTFGVPDLNAYFTLHTRAPNGVQLISDIRDSLTVLPPDKTIVPFVPGDKETVVVDALRETGLAVDVESWTCPDTASCFAGITDISPAVGSVVPAGSAVTVTVARP